MDRNAVSSSITSASDAFPEDRFHIKLPADVDQYSGAPLAVTDLPEDKFHRNDAGSAHYISQREESAREKRIRHEK